MKLADCPDCGKALRTRDRCACGWRREFEEEFIVDHRCHYQFEGKRCHLPGTIANSLYGKSIAWYCAYHSPHGGNHLKGNCLNDVSYDDYVKSRVDWRKELFPEEQQIFKKRR